MSQPSATDTKQSLDASLHHVLVVGGTVQQWAETTEQAWSERVMALGTYCSSVGVPWLTLRAYELGADEQSEDLKLWTRSFDGCEVVVDPTGDGRQRFADAMMRLDSTDEVNEASVASVLYEPADCEPDLVVVLGPSTQLPPSLVWELAYAELVFVSVPWVHFGADDLALAIGVFAQRRRRFGGLGDE